MTGTLISQQRYLPFSEARTNIPSPNLPGTDFGYTAQRDLDPGMGGLMDYKARFYSPYLNRFIQPDTLIPDPSNPQAWNLSVLNIWGSLTNRGAGLRVTKGTAHRLSLLLFTIPSYLTFAKESL